MGLLGDVWACLLGRKEVTAAVQPPRGDGAFVPIPRWTHAKRSGTGIRCPGCANKVLVFDFAWSVLLCRACGVVSKKTEWLIRQK